jgi:hypothetical protein
MEDYPYRNRVVSKTAGKQIAEANQRYALTNIRSKPAL